MEASIYQVVMFAVIVQAITITHGARTLYFNSYNCDETARSVSKDKTYTLTWSGDKYPRPCSFNFTTDINSQICFESTDLNLPSFGVYVHITDKIDHWSVIGANDKKEKTCGQSSDLGISLELTDAYTESSTWFIQIKITVTEQYSFSIDSIWESIQSYILDAVPFIILVVVLVCVCKHKDRLWECVKSKITQIPELCGFTSKRSSSDSDREGSIHLREENDEQANNFRESRRGSSMSIDGTNLPEIELTLIEEPSEPDGFPPAYPSAASPPPYPATTDPIAPPPSYEEVVKDSNNKLNNL